MKRLSQKGNNQEVTETKGGDTMKNKEEKISMKKCSVVSDTERSNKMIAENRTLNLTINQS